MARQSQLTLRIASMEDAEILREWRNEPEVRAESRNTGKVEPEEHISWLRRTLADPDRDLFIAELGGEPIGQVRLDRRSAKEREISVSIRKSSRRRGLGTDLIRAGVRWAREAGGERIVAEIRSGNDASLRAFRQAGFREEASPSPPGAGFVRLEYPGRS